MCSRQSRKFHAVKAGSARRPSSSGGRQQKLKAERVQQELKAMPGWTLQTDGKAITCLRRFTHPAAVAEFASFVAVLAAAERQPVVIAIYGSRVSVTLPPALRPGGFTLRDLELARQIG